MPAARRRRLLAAACASLLVVGACLGVVAGAPLALPGEQGRIGQPLTATLPLGLGASDSGAAGAGPLGAVILPEVLHHGDRGRPLVALTFDTNLTAGMITELDHGLVPRFVNDRAIGELERLQVPATIFLSGRWIERYPDVARRLAADPLVELGSHSYSHLGFAAGCYDLGRIAPADEAADIHRSETVLARITSRPTRFFRFPGGCYDRTALAAARAAGVVVVQYDVPSGDAFSRDPGAIAAHTLGSVRDGSIVVLHLTGGNTAPVTDRALPLIVAGLRQHGFTLVTLSQLIAAGRCG